MKHLLFFIFGTVLSANLLSQNVERYMQYHDKGRMLILEAKYKEAIPQLDTAIQIMPYYPTIFQDRGYAFMQLKMYKKAVQDFDHVLSKKPYLHEVRLQRGMALYHLHHLNEAEADLLEVLKATPSGNQEAFSYLDNIDRERQIIAKQNKEQVLQELRFQAESERIQRARHREEVIWNTVVPLAFWTTVFLTW